MSAERTAAQSPVAGEPGGAATSPGSSAAQGRRWWQFWRRSERSAPFTTPAPQTLSWPSAVMLCVRQPVAHHAILLPYENYPAEYPNVFGPPRHGLRCSDCGALLYVAAARVKA